MATVVFSLPDNLAEFAQEKGIFKPEWFETIARNAIIKLAEEEPDSTKALPCAMQRIGFLKGKISCPSDFDTMGQEEIIAMFEGET